jgi:hypothetical protein
MLSNFGKNLFEIANEEDALFIESRAVAIGTLCQIYCRSNAIDFS